MEYAHMVFPLLKNPDITTHSGEKIDVIHSMNFFPHNHQMDVTDLGNRREQP
jgi:hypothetical protein